MKNFYTSVVLVLVLACAAPGAVVTFTMSLNDNGAGQSAIGQWALYASASADSGGLFGFGVDLLPFTGTLLNRAPGLILEDPDTGQQYNLGFTAGRTQDLASGKFSGLADLGAGSFLIPVYGMGQQPGRLEDHLPPGIPPPVTISTTGSGRAPYGQETWEGLNLFLLGRGNYTGPAPAIDVNSVDTLASVYNSRSGTANSRATMAFRTRTVGHGDPCWVFGPCGSATVTNAPASPNQAVGGFVEVSGSNNAYVSEVDQLLDPSVDKGSVRIETIGDEAGSIYVMAKLGSNIAGGVEGQLRAMSQDVDSSDPQFEILHRLYDSKFAGGGFNALFKLPNIAGPKYFNWDMQQVWVDQLAVVPEPAGVLSLCGLASLLIRRRNPR